MTAWDDGPDCKVWTPSLTPSNGDAVPLDGSVHWATANLDLVPDWTYETRDTRRVIRCNTIPQGGSSYDNMCPLGPDFDRNIFIGLGWEWKLTFYCNLAYIAWRRSDNYGNFQSIYPRLDHRTGTVSLTLTAQFTGEDGLVVGGAVAGLPDTSLWTAGWFVMGMRITSDGSCYAMMKRESDADNWLSCHATAKWNDNWSKMTHPRMYVIRVLPDNPAAVFDIWKYEWRTV